MRLGLCLLALCAAAPLAHAAEAGPDCRTVRFAGPDWADIRATNGAATAVLQAIGYDAETSPRSVPSALNGLAGGEFDVFLGVWLPSMEDELADYLAANEIEIVGPNLEGARYTLAVPAYTAEAGLTGFEHIRDFKSALEAKVHGIEPGNDGNRLILSMIRDGAFGLDEFTLVESSEEGMLQQVRTAIGQGRHVVFLGWEPHPMNSEFAITYLSGGDIYFGPGQGAATVHTAVRAGYLEACPNVGRFLSNLEFSLSMENELMLALHDGAADPRDAARDWLSRHPDVLGHWLEGVTTADGEPAIGVLRQAWHLD
jgi:glycine betaine/proline transport system substrate-binding protein